MKDILNLYFDPNFPGSYAGLNKFYKHLRKNNIPVSFNKLKKYLTEHDTYALHKPIKKKFQRNRILALGINDTWQADLVDLTKLSKYNKGFKYLLTCIDVFSKRGWIEPLKNKSGKEITNAFAKIFKKFRPKKIQTDKGKEFLNKNFAKLLKKENIHLYQINSEMKASVVERFNRTIKEKMWRYFTRNNTNNYINIIQNLLSSYNNTYHRSIKMEPSKVNIKNQKEVYKNLYDSYNNDFVNFKFKVGDKVRVSKNKTFFEKGYTANWSKEIFIVNKQILRSPPVYELKDYNQEIIEGFFYEAELQKVYKFDEIFEIDKILKSRINKSGIKEYYVSWRGYPSKFNSWISSKDILE